MIRRVVPWLAVSLVLAAACGTRRTERPAELRVISLAPSVTRILQAVGADHEIVGIDEMSRRIGGLESVVSVGGLFNPDLERIIALEPTLLIAVRSEQHRPALDQLRMRGIEVREIAPYTLEEVLASFVDVGRWVEREPGARALVGEIRAGLDGVGRSVDGRSRVSTALVVQRDPLYVVGRGSFAHELIEVAGGANVFADLDAPYPRVSLEALARRAPEVILDSGVDADGDEASARAARRFWSRFSWVERVEVLPSGPITLPGPELVRAAELLAERIHGAPPRVGQ